MHIPNGYLSDPVCAATLAASAAGYGLSLWQVRRWFDRQQCRTLAVAAAAVFAAQLVNFPVDHGTSGHLIGAAAIAILLGPWAATLALGVVLATQALLFGDGACATWGANLLVMGIVAPWTAWATWQFVVRHRPAAPQTAAAGSAAFASVLAAAATCGLLLAVGGTAPLAEVMPAMLWAHALVAVAEALLTAGLVALVAGRKAARALPQAVTQPVRAERAPTRLLAACAAAALLLAPWACAAPDGLERVAERLGFADRAAAGLALVAPDYLLPGLTSAPAAIGLAGLIGAAVALAAAYAVGRVAVRREV